MFMSWNLTNTTKSLANIRDKSVWSRWYNSEEVYVLSNVIWTTTQLIFDLNGYKKKCNFACWQKLYEINKLFCETPAGV